MAIFSTERWRLCSHSLVQFMIDDCQTWHSSACHPFLALRKNIALKNALEFLAILAKLSGKQKLAQMVGRKERTNIETLCLRRQILHLVRYFVLVRILIEPCEFAAGGLHELFVA